jgi:hypothetical protein
MSYASEAETWAEERRRVAEREAARQAARDARPRGLFAFIWRLL